MKMSFNELSQFSQIFEGDDISLSPTSWMYDEEEETSFEDFWNDTAPDEEEEQLFSMASKVIRENGQNDLDWVRFLQHFKSAPVYAKRIDHFIQSDEHVMTTEE